MASKGIKLFVESKERFYTGSSTAREAFSTRARDGEVPPTAPSRTAAGSSICLDHGNSHDFIGQSTSQSDFQAQRAACSQIPSAGFSAREEFEHKREPFYSGSSVAKSSFAGLSGKAAESSKTAAGSSIDLSHGDEKSARYESTSRSSYQFPGVKPVSKPSHSATKSSTPLRDSGTFDGRTTSRESYVAQRSEKSVRSHTAAMASIKLAQDDEKGGEYLSTSSSSYQGASGIPAQKSCVASMSSTPLRDSASVPFTGSSMSKDDYVYKNGAQPAVPSKTASRTSTPLKDSGAFYGDTTSKDSYRGLKNSETVTKCNSNASQSLQGIMMKPGKVYFHGSTTSGEAFQGTPGKRQPLSKAAAESSLSLCHEGSHGIANSTAKDSFKGWQLPLQRKSVGLEMVGDVFHVMVPSNMRLPVERKQVFTTVAANQTEVEIVVRQGEESTASKNDALATFELIGIPPGPAGSAQIEVTFAISALGLLHINARDKLSGKHQHIAIERSQNQNAFQ